jgi:tetratricopeptide (TPR) repeat protein
MHRPIEAEPLRRRALEIDELTKGSEHPIVATDLNNLAELLQDMNRLAEAEPLMRRALAIDEKNKGPEHPDVATDLNNLAQLFLHMNRFAESEALMRKALIIIRDSSRSTSDDHPALIPISLNYCGVLRAMGKSQAEIEAALEALEVPQVYVLEKR